MKQKRRKLRAIDPSEQRWNHNILRGVEGSRHNVTSTPLDSYYHAEVITLAQYTAGDDLRRLWAAAGLEPKITSSMEPRTDPVHESDQEAERRSRAWRAYLERRDKLTPTLASVAYNVYCHGVGAEAWARGKGLPAHVGIVMLQAALKELSAGSASV